MNVSSLFDSSVKKLSQTNNLSKIKVIYLDSNNKPLIIKDSIYEDDTSKDVLLKLSSRHSNTTSEHIFAWYKEGLSIKPLGFSYYSIELNHPYKNKKLDERFITSDKNRIVVLTDKTPLHDLIEGRSIKTIYYTTIQDYLRYLGLNTARELSDEQCTEKTSHTCKDIYNGKVVQYWPFVTLDQMINLPKTTLPEKLKIEREVVKQMAMQTGSVFKKQSFIEPEEYEIQVMSLSNQDESNIVHLGRLFNDISLGKRGDSVVPFSKITLDDYTSRYCKLLKDTAVVTTVNEKRYVTKELLVKWFNDQVTSLSSSPSVKHMNESNSVAFKLYKDTRYITLIIYSNGSTKLLFNGHSLILTSEYIQDMIQLANTFIKHLNKQKIFSEKSLSLIDTSYETCLQFATFQLTYPIKNYKQDLFVRLIKNMNTFVRFNKIQETKIYAIYKRVSQYGQSISSVISSLQKSKQNLTRDELIVELERIFNISNDEASDELYNWESDASAKYSKGGEEGIEIVIDLSGTNIRVDVTGVQSYSELGRVYRFLNFSITYYEEYMKTKKDPYNYFSGSSSSIIDQLETQELEQEIELQRQVDEQEDEQEDAQQDAQQIKSETNESVLSDRESLEERVTRNIDSTGSIDADVLQLESEQSSLETDASDGSDDFEMGRLDDSDSSGGYLQQGGYNVNRYYLNRLQKYDNHLFKKHASIPRKNSYSVKCGAVIGRQPVAITKNSLDLYNSTDEGEGVAFSEAVNVDGRDPNIYYICPKYWDIKDERPRDPSKLDEFEDFLVDNKMTTSQKKNTDNYVLVRDEGGYWKEAGNDIERYRIEMLKGSHPDGYDLPCCNAPRKGANKYPPGWEVEILLTINGKFRWKQGKVKSSTKTNVTVIQGGRTITVPIGNVRRAKGGKNLVTSFPLDIDTYGHVDQMIKQLVKQPLDYPIKAHNMGLVRKGVFRATQEGDHSFLESITEILSDRIASASILRKHIDRDLRDLYKLDKRIIMSIAGGGFINKFKMETLDLDERDVVRFISSIVRKYKFISNKISGITGDKAKMEKLLKGASRERLIIYNELNIFTAIVNFSRYLKDMSEVITDEILIPVLTTISQYKSKTFGEPIPGLSIIVFERISEDVIITPPLGGFQNKSQSMILLYKERRHMYEPIFYRKYTEHVGILHQFDDTNYFYDQNENIKMIHKSIQTKLDNFINETESDLVDLSELELIMRDLNMPIVNYIYDGYYKIVFVQTKDNVLIPVKPATVKKYMNAYLLSSLTSVNFPKYSDLLSTLSVIDKRLRVPYLPNHEYSVVNEKRSANLLIKEIILSTGVYIPIKNEIYNSSIHKGDINTLESCFLIDKYLGLTEVSTDIRIDYLRKNEYYKKIQRLFFQMIYLEIKDNDELMDSIREIKSHPIMLRKHRSDRILTLLEPIAKSKTIVDDTKIKDYNLFEIDQKLLIKPILGMNASMIFYKLLKLMIECLLNYTEKDYERFLQLEINYAKLKDNLSENEILFSYKDILNDNYLDYFVRQSHYIRNYILSDEPIQHSKLIQLHRFKEKEQKRIQGKFIKQYPQIIHKRFGRKVDLITYPNSEYTESEVIYTILNKLYSDSEITLDLIESLVGKSKITETTLDTLSQNEKFRNIAFCLITTESTKKLQHDIHVAYQRKIDEHPLIVLYQTMDSLIHVKKREDEFLLKDLND